MKTKYLTMLALGAAVFGVRAAVVPFTPKEGSTVTLLPPEQKKVMNLATYDERLALLQADSKGDKKLKHGKWRQSLPLVLRWKCTAGEKGPWLVKIGKKADLSDAREWWLAANDHDLHARKADGQPAWKFVVPMANLEIGATYYWKVWSNVKCPQWECGSTLEKPCKCGKGPVAHASEVQSFKTEDMAPRWIQIEGTTGNFRDLGGRRTKDGRRVKQGLVYRSQGLNYNSVNGLRVGRNRLTVEDVKYLTGTLGIKTDLDLRSSGETAHMKESPLGPGVKFIHHSSSCYKGGFEKHGKEMTAANFRVFCDEKNYPILFHCIGGADRTGLLGYVLNGVLGVDRHELETDWEATFYPTLSEMRKDYKDHSYWCGEWHFNDGFSKYGDANSTWNERVELYLLDCGVTKEEIAKFRSIMLED